MRLMHRSIRDRLTAVCTAAEKNSSRVKLAWIDNSSETSTYQSEFNSRQLTRRLLWDSNESGEEFSELWRRAELAVPSADLGQKDSPYFTLRSSILHACVIKGDMLAFAFRKPPSRR